MSQRETETAIDRYQGDGALVADETNRQEVDMSADIARAQGDREPMTVEEAEQVLESHAEFLAETGSGHCFSGGRADEAMAFARSMVTDAQRAAVEEANQVLLDATAEYRAANPAPDFVSGDQDIPF
jgi:hypothetical protein